MSTDRDIAGEVGCAQQTVSNVIDYQKRNSSEIGKDADGPAPGDGQRTAPQRTVHTSEHPKSGRTFTHHRTAPTPPRKPLIIKVLPGKGQGG